MKSQKEAINMSKKKLEKFLEGYAKAGAPSNRSAIRDLLTDVLHLCDEYRVNFYDISTDAVQVYSEEKEMIKEESLDS
jgi:hypothetical protein